MKYRTHSLGPIVEIRVETGAVVVTMTADQWPCIVKMHSHAFAHYMKVLKGRVEISVDGITTRLSAGDRVLVEAHKQHSLVFGERDTVVECRHENAEIHELLPGDGIPLEWLDKLTDRTAA